MQRGECSVLGLPPPAVLGCHHLSPCSVQGRWQGRGPSTNPVPAMLSDAGQPPCQRRGCTAPNRSTAACGGLGSYFWSSAGSRALSRSLSRSLCSVSIRTLRPRKAPVLLCGGSGVGPALPPRSCLSRGRFRSRPVLLPHPCGSILCLLLIAAVLRRG